MADQRDIVDRLRAGPQPDDDAVGPDYDNQLIEGWCAFAGEAAGEIERLRGALEKAREAMDTWICTYADDQVGDEAFQRACARIRECGTLAYIAEINGVISSALEPRDG